MKNSIIIICLVVLVAIVGFIGVNSALGENVEATDNNPVWLEVDSAKAIAQRTRSDFSLTFDEAVAKVQETHPEVTADDVHKFISNHYMEAMVIDDTLRVHRKSPRNLNLLNPAMGRADHRGANASKQRILFVDSVLNYYKGKNIRGNAHRVVYRYSVDVPYHEAIANDTLRVWLPMPLSAPEGGRQSDVEILEAYPSEYILSEGHSQHSSIYFTSPTPSAEDEVAHFSVTVAYTTRGAWASEEDILRNMQAFDPESEVVKKYTTFDNPHIIRLDSLAKAIVGDETNPYRQSELVYDYIINKYPWAGAREYSTIPCIPEYVVNEGHGDCGQVSLLYISLMRTLGVPARWESGWMIHPGELNLHDWAEVYFPGTGWLPVDVSFGRYTSSENPDIIGFYSHGIDAHRLAVNSSVSEDFYPKKRYVRSETVDFQVGEVETSQGNLFYPAWEHSMELLSVEPISE